jgi:hypothetical protein
MFFAAVDVVENGSPALAKYVDPFGTSPFALETTADGFRIVSELTYGNYSSGTKTWQGKIVLSVGRTASGALAE